MPKAKNVNVTRITRSIVPVGEDNYEIRATDDGKGVLITNKNGTMFVPSGENGRTILNEALGYVGNDAKPAAKTNAGNGQKRVRRTAEQIAAGLTVEDIKAGRTVPAANTGDAANS
jgi:hypothetical protein